MNVAGKSVLVAAATLLLNACALPITVQDRIAMHEGSWQVCSTKVEEMDECPGGASNLESEKDTASALFRVGQRVYLEETSMLIVDNSEAQWEIPLKRLNQQVLPLTDGAERAKRLMLQQQAASGIRSGVDLSFDDCWASAKNMNEVPNFVGFHEKKKFCLFVSLIAHANNIDRDILQVEYSGGPIAPGIVIGGPRPQMRDPRNLRSAR
jgi:hypothetical protein